MINSDLVNNLGNLLNRATTKRLNPTQRYPAFDVEVMEHDLKGTGEKLVLELKTLLGNTTFVYYSKFKQIRFRASRKPLRRSDVP